MLFLLCYENVCNDMSILAGPITKDQVSREMERVVQKKLCEYGKTEEEANQMVREAREGNSSRSIIFHDQGASIYYQEKPHTRPVEVSIQVVEYQMPETLGTSEKEN